MADPQFLKQEKTAEKLMTFLFLTLLISAFFFNTPQEIWQGSLVILRSPANLITDYFELANIGAALVNAAVMTLASLLLLHYLKVELNGNLLSSLFNVTGFSLFGKNLFNSIPIVLGMLLYARLTRRPFKENASLALLGTALGPLVSEIAFNTNLKPLPAITLAYLAGMAVGFALPPLFARFFDFHRGFSLYNAGFTCGIIGTFFVAVLRSVGITIEPVAIVQTGHNREAIIILALLFTALISGGLGLAGGLRHGNWRQIGRSWRDLMKRPGKAPTDFVLLYGYGLAFLNMAACGMLATLYVLLLGGSLNGPVIASVLAVIGFAAYGLHPLNVLPIFAGIVVAGLFNIYDLHSTPVMTAALFGTNLAPISGEFGPLAGMVAGAIHVGLVTHVIYLHGGVNLYNNGFSGGFVAAALVPLLLTLRQIRKVWHQPR